MADEPKWLLDWFEQRGSVPGGTLEDQLQVNYFEAGLVDSLGVIELITEVEDHFGIHFNERHFQDRRFSTIGGLSDVIAELSNGRDGNLPEGGIYR